MMATVSTTLDMESLYHDLMSLCSMDDTFYYKDIRLNSIHYRVFNYRLCSYAAFQSRAAALNARGTMFNIMNSKNIRLVSLPPEKFFNYYEGFGRKQFHQRGRFGDKMEKMDGTLISTFLHRTGSNEEVVRLKSKQSLTSKQAVEAMQLLVGDLKSEIDRLVRLNYTVNMEYTSPGNHVFVSYSQARLTVLSIRSHADGEALFGSRLKAFLSENNFLAILDQLVPFESVPSVMSHEQLLEDVYQQPAGEGYVVEIVQADRPSYLVKIKTQKYLRMHRDGEDANSPRSLFEAIIHEQSDDLRGLFQDDADALTRIDEMEQHIRPKYNRMVESIEQFYQANKRRSKREFTRTITMTETMKIYLPLLMKLYAGEENDYKGFAMKHAKELFGMDGNGKSSATVNEDTLE